MFFHFHPRRNGFGEVDLKSMFRQQLWRTRLARPRRDPRSQDVALEVLRDIERSTWQLSKDGSDPMAEPRRPEVFAELASLILAPSSL